ncbi:MAG: SPOR domain-containing protein [Sphingomonadales bacterium]|nr:SPOR domain-containing protein [Sphingomonadales bacterium]
MTLQSQPSRRLSASRLTVASTLAAAIFATSGGTALARSDEAQAQMDQCAAKFAIAGSAIGGTAAMALGPAGALASAGGSAVAGAGGQAAGSVFCKDPDVVAAQNQAKAIAKVELSVAKAPKNAATRAELGQTYIKYGRFVSAAAALGDAVSLGDQSSRTLLGLALAQIANGQGHDAIATLDGAQGRIPAGDLGLALALAGETGRGVAMLSDAVRAGSPTAKLRQNLAYAYALDGRWSEARMTASLDVPADQLSTRLEQWARSMRAGADQERVAALLGAPLVQDSGMPTALALTAPAAAPALARAEPAAPAPAAELPAAPAPATAVATAEPDSAVAVAAAALPPEPTAAPATAEPAPHALAVAEAPAPAPTPAPATGMQFVSNPVVQVLPTAHAPHGARHLAAAPAHAAPAVREATTDAEPGSHAIQLGAFSNAANAKRAVALFEHKPDLAGHKFVVSQAKVHGRDFWRVAVTGFDSSGAGSLCSSLRQSGGACFAYVVRPATLARPDKPSHGPALAARR